MTKEPQTDSERRIWAAAWFFILVVSALPYISSLKGLPVWDDYGILNGGGIGGGKEILTVLTQPFNFAYFRPMVSLSFFIDHKLFGPSPFFFHQTNIILHLACTAASGWLAHLLFRNRMAAAFAALLFGLQPVQAGATAWIGGRTDVLCCLFVVLYACFLVKMAREPKIIKWSALAAVSLLCAGLCKEQAMAGILAAPFALALLAPGDRPSARDYIRPAIPLALSCAAFLALWTTFGMRTYFAQPHTLLQQLELGGRGLAHNLLLLAAPTPAALHTFTFEPSRLKGVLPVIAGWLALLAALWACFKFRSSHPQLVWLALFAGLLILPVSSVIPLPSLHVAPYRLAIAGPAVACLMAAGLIAAKPVVRWPLLALILGWHGGLTVWAAPRWTSETEIFSTIVRYDPGFITARLNYAGSNGVSPEEGAASTRQLLDWIFGSPQWSDPAWAETEFQTNQEVRRRLQDNVGNESDPPEVLAGVFVSLSVSLLDADDLDGAEAAAKTALLFNPKSSRAHTLIGDVALKSGRFEDAVASFEQAAALNPSDLWPYMSMAEAHRAAKNPDEAIQALERTAELAPWLPTPWVEIVDICVEQRWYDRASEAVKTGYETGALTEENRDSLASKIQAAAESRQLQDPQADTSHPTL